MNKYYYFIGGLIAGSWLFLSKRDKKDVKKEEVLKKPLEVAKKEVKQIEKVADKIDDSIKKQEQKTKEIIKKFVEQPKQPDPAPEVITTMPQLEEIKLRAKRERLDTEEIKSLEQRVQNETDLINSLTNKLQKIDQSTKGGKDNANLILDIIKKAEARKRAKAKDITTIIDVDAGQTGYQQLLPKPEWTLEDLLDENVRIIIKDKLANEYPNNRKWYEYNPIDSEVQFNMKGNWVAWSPKYQKTLLVLNKRQETAVLSGIAKDPRRYDVRFYKKIGATKTIDLPPSPTKGASPIKGKPAIKTGGAKPSKPTSEVQPTKKTGQVGTGTKITKTTGSTSGQDALGRPTGRGGNIKSMPTPTGGVKPSKQTGQIGKGIPIKKKSPIGNLISKVTKKSPNTSGQDALGRPTGRGGNIKSMPTPTGGINPSKQTGQVGKGIPQVRLSTGQEAIGRTGGIKPSKQTGQVGKGKKIISFGDPRGRYSGREPQVNIPRGASITPRGASSSPRGASSSPRGESITPRGASINPRGASSNLQAKTNPRFQSNPRGIRFGSTGMVQGGRSSRDRRSRFSRGGR